MALSSANAENICRKHGMQHGFFTMSADGADLQLFRVLTSSISYDKVRVSPDGGRMVFLECLRDINDNCLCDEEEYTQKQVVVADLGGGHRRVVGAHEGGFNDYPGWSPDGASVAFMHSSSQSVAGADLFRYDLKRQLLTKIADTPDLMESDHHWHRSGTMTVVAQPLREGRLNGPGNVFAFPILGSKMLSQLTHFEVSLGDHCCAADPKYSPDMGSLVYSRFSKKHGPEGDWDIILRSRDGKEEDLSQNDSMDLWPMWNRDGSKLLWVSWDAGHGTYSVIVRDMKVGKKTTIPLVGEGVEPPLGDKTIIFGRVNWPTWFPGDPERIFFPATYLVVDGT